MRHNRSEREILLHTPVETCLAACQLLKQPSRGPEARLIETAPHVETAVSSRLISCPQAAATSVVRALAALDPDAAWLVLARVVRPASAVENRHLPPPDAAYEMRAAPLLAEVEAMDVLWGPGR